MIIARLFHYITKTEFDWKGYYTCCPRIGECIEEDGIVYIVMQIVHSNSYGLLIYIKSIDEYLEDRSRK